MRGQERGRGVAEWGCALHESFERGSAREGQHAVRSVCARGSTCACRCGAIRLAFGPSLHARPTMRKGSCRSRQEARLSVSWEVRGPSSSLFGKPVNSGAR